MIGNESELYPSPVLTFRRDRLTIGPSVDRLQFPEPEAAKKCPVSETASGSYGLLRFEDTYRVAPDKEEILCSQKFCLTLDEITSIGQGENA